LSTVKFDLFNAKLAVIEVLLLLLIGGRRPDVVKGD